MKIREYPKTLIAYLDVSTVSGYEKLERYKEVVYNQTSYDSFIKTWRVDRKCIIDERLSKWNELEGKNFLFRIWFILPHWAITILAYLLGIITKIILP